MGILIPIYYNHLSPPLTTPPFYICLWENQPCNSTMAHLKMCRVCSSEDTRCAVDFLVLAAEQIRQKLAHFISAKVNMSHLLDPCILYIYVSMFV